jgi:hypothetical protein
MMHIKYFYSKRIWLVLFLFYSAMIYGQQSLNITDLYSDYFLSRQARTIQEQTNLGAGGVAFESIALPSRAIGNSKISLDYESGQFSITVGKQKIYPEIPDWKLIPTAKFADSPYQVLFSSAGDTVNNREAQCRYHPAFLNTFAGLRIFQTDFLNIPGMLWDLPKDSEREYLLAKSEKPFTPRDNKTIEQTLVDDLSGKGRPFSSFILTDRGVNIIFDIQGGQLQFSGHPYYLFSKSESDPAQFDRLKRDLERTYIDIESNSKAFLGRKYTSELNPRTNLAGLLKVLQANRKDESFNPYAFKGVTSALNKLDSLISMSEAGLGVKFTVLNQFSTTFNENNWELLKRYNPPVYSTVEDIARWAAFFRYVKRTNPANWNYFIEKISGRPVNDAPKVDTPTTYEINYFRLLSN